MLDSKRIIVQRTLSCWKDYFPPNKADNIFLQQLNKFVNYDVQENLELAKRNAHTFEYGDAKNKLHIFNSTDFSRCYKIVQHDDTLKLKPGKFCDV